ncbi:MarR family winged helix-turn-helix transcriptional regulator [Planctomicrobium sp. SH527]|uniref:MarR family winged helix-turn-helix transcriptional regulator n=1 Tax=Planctomicrobium sp. SH527 TaxID=3448123 RepID=UPI003F5C4573
MPAVTSKTRHFDSPQQEAYLNLWKTYDKLKEIEDDVFAEYDLSAQQYNALRVLRSVAPESMSTSALGGMLVTRAPDMTRLLDKLERRGFVQRERREENRRIVLVAITSQGQDLLKKLAEPVKKCHETQLGHLSEKELKHLTQLLAKARGEST